MSIYEVRHGETEWNVLHKVQGKADIDLNDRGIIQAVEVREAIKNIKIDIVITSPLKRAVRTAQIISEEMNVEIIEDDRISERDFGEFEGLHKKEFDFVGFWSYKRNYTYKEAENIRDFFKRIYSFLDEIKEKYKGKNILIVAHGGVSIPMYCYFNEIPEDDDLISIALGNCEVAKFNI